MSELKNYYLLSKTLPPKQALEIILKTSLQSDLELSAEQISKLDYMPDQFWVELEEKYPKTVKYLNNPYALKAIESDFDKVWGFEDIYLQFKRGLEYSELLREQSRISGEIKNKRDKGEEVEEGELENLKQINEKIKEFEQKKAPKPWEFKPFYYLSSQTENILEPIKYGLIGAGVGGVAGAVSGPGALITAGKGFGTGYLTGVFLDTFELEKNLSYASMVLQGVDHKTASEYSNIVGLINASIETSGDFLLGKIFSAPVLLSASKLISNIPYANKIISNIIQNPTKFKNLPIKEAIIKSALDIIKGTTTEVTQEFTQEVVSQTAEQKAVSGEIDINNLIENASKVIDPTLQTALLPVLLGGFVGFTGYYRTGKENLATNAYQKIGSIAEKIKLKDTAKPVLEDLIKNVYEGTEFSKLYVEKEKFLKYLDERGLNKDVYSQLLGVDFDTSQNYIEVPTEKWVSAFAGTEHYQQLKDFVKFSPEELTESEIKEYQETAKYKLEEKINLEIEKDWKDLFEDIRDNVLKQLQRVYQKDLVDIELFSNAFAYLAIAEAKRRGLTKEEFAKEFKIPKFLSLAKDQAETLYSFLENYEIFDILPNELPEGVPELENTYLELLAIAESQKKPFSERVINSPEYAKYLEQKNKLLLSKINDILEGNKIKKINDLAEKFSLEKRIRFVKLKDLPRRAKKEGVEIKAFTKGGLISFVLDNIKEDEIEKVFLHEVIGHIGLRNILGHDKFTNLCREIFENAKEYVEEIKQKYGIKLLDQEAIDYIGEEILALLIEKSVTEREIFSKYGFILNKYLGDILNRPLLHPEDWKELFLSNYNEDFENKVLNKIDTYKFSIKSWEEFKNNPTKKWSETEKIKFIDKVVDLISKKYPDLEEDFIEKYSALKPNSDFYKVSIDFSTECRRRREYSSTLALMLEEFYKKFERFPTKDEVLEFKKFCEKEGIITPCDACYVESARLNVLGSLEKLKLAAKSIEEDGDFVKYFENKKNFIKKLTEIKEFYLKNKNILDQHEKASDIISSLDAPKRFAILAEKKPKIVKEYYQLWEDVFKLLGTTAGKAIETRTSYKHEILTINEKLKEKLNEMSGIRMQSWSDFEIEHLVDMLQVIGDLEEKGLKAHVYTKIYELALLLSKTNVAVNMSLIPTNEGINEKGELQFDEKQSFDIKKGLELREKYENIGFETIGVNDKQILKALETDYIDYIIPYHASGLSKDLRAVLRIEKWKDYTNIQTEKVLPEGVKDFEEYDDLLSKELFESETWYSGVLKVKEYKKEERYKYKNKEGISFLEKLQAKYFNSKLQSPEEKIVFSKKGIDEDVSKYIEYCKKNRLIPKFYAIFQNDGQSIIYNKNYYKLLVDRRLYNKNGEKIEQKPVKFNFDFDIVKQIIDTLPRAKEKANENVVEKFFNSGKIKVFFHGTGANFEMFDLSKVGTGTGVQAYGFGIYLSDSKEVANYYKNTASELILHIDGEKIITKIIDEVILKKIADKISEKNLLVIGLALARYIENNFDWDKVDLQVAKELKNVLKAESKGLILEVQSLGPLKTIGWWELTDEDVELLESLGFERDPDLIKEKYMIEKKYNIRFRKGIDLYNSLKRKLGSAKKASAYLKKIGLDGVRYKTKYATNYVVFNTDKLKIVKKYFQEHKGYYNFEDNIIAISTTAGDLTTFLHETAHFFLSDILKYIKSGKASEKYIEETKPLLKYLGIDEKTLDPTLEAQEKFALEFEKYFLEAEPTKFKKIFYRIKERLISIFERKKETPVYLSQEVKSFVDLLLKYGEAIKVENFEIEYSIREELYESLVKKFKEKREEFIQKAWELKEKEVIEYLNQLPHISAYKRIKETLKLDPKNINPNLVFGEQEIILKIIAEENGYSSISEMIDDIKTKPTFEESLDFEKAEFMQKMSDVKNDEEINGIIIEKLEKHKAILEIDYFLSKIKDNKILDAYKKFLKEIDIIVESETNKFISNLLVKDIRNIEKYQKIAFREREKALLQFSKGDYAKALQHKKAELLNLEIYKKLRKIKKKTEKIIEKLETISKKNKEFFYKEEYYLAVKYLLNSFGFENEVTVNYPLKSLIEQYSEMTSGFDIPDWILNEQYKPYSLLKVDELIDLANAIENILHIKNLEKEARLLVTNARISEIAKKLQLPKEKNKNTKLTNKKTIFEKIIDLKDQAKTSLLTIETMLQELDGGELMGEWWKTFYKPVEEASNQEAKELIQAGKDIEKIFSKYSKEELKKMDSELIFIDAIGQSLTKFEIMAVALNCGNDGNKQRLLDGYGWDENTLQRILDKLDKRDWDTIQEIWDYIDSYWERIVMLYKDLAGFTPTKVQPTPVFTKYGVYKGGYYPLVRNAKFDPKGMTEEEIDRLLNKEPAIWKASTKNSHTKERFSKAIYPVSLDINVFRRHIFQVIHDLNFRRVIIDLSKLLENKEISGKIIQYYGIDGFREFQNWVKALAGNNPIMSREWFEKIFAFLRKRFIVSALFWRLSTMFQQFSTFSVVLGSGEIKVEKLAKAMFDTYWAFLKGDGDKIKKFIFEKSVYMSTRSETFDRDLNKVVDKLFGRKEFLIEFAKSGITEFDMLVAIPTWVAGYEEGINRFNGDEKQAVEFADMIVRKTQGSGFIKDLPSIMRGSETKRIFTLFYSWMNALLNLYYLTFKQYSFGKIGNAKLIGRLAALWIFPVVLSELLSLRVPDPEEDEEEFVKFWVKKILIFPIQTVPFIRDMIDMIMDKILHLRGGGYRVTPLQSVFENTGILLNTITKEDPEPIEVVESASKVASILAPYPEQINILVFNFVDWLNGMEFKWSDLTKRRIKEER